MKSEQDTFFAFTVKNSRIVKTYTEAEFSALGANLPANSVDLQGRHVYPCLIDGHTHLMHTIVISAMGFDLCEITEKGIEFPPFDGFAFYIASPIYITLFGLYIRRGRAWRDFALLPFFILHLLLLLMHRTMGGWQFGNRYTVDLLPFVLLPKSH